MGEREDGMREAGIYYCPKWCVQDPAEEDGYEAHQGEWQTFVFDDVCGDTISVRPTQSWGSTDDGDTDWNVEVDIKRYDPTGPLILDPDALSDLLTLLEEAAALACDDTLVKPAWPGAQAEAEQGNQEGVQG